MEPDIILKTTRSPNYLVSSELTAFELPSDIPVTGHIDILQVRGNKVHIMDYKSGAGNDKNAASQLLLMHSHYRPVPI